MNRKVQPAAHIVSKHRQKAEPTPEVHPSKGPQERYAAGLMKACKLDINHVRDLVQLAIADAPPVHANCASYHA